MTRSGRGGGTAFVNKHELSDEMGYHVHHFTIDMERDQKRLEEFLNSLEGEVVSIVPNVGRTTLPQIYGMARKVDFLLIVELRAE